MFQYLNKEEKEKWLPSMFDLYYGNMRGFFTGNHSYEEEKAAWLGEVSPALDKAPRQVILRLEDGKLTGYLQYYIRDGLLMVEELQLMPALWQTTAFFGLCRFLVRALPGDLQRVEAYAHKGNSRSVRLMERLGMQILPEEGSPFAHLAGAAQPMYARLGCK